jgi:hypothetical protein
MYYFVERSVAIIKPKQAFLEWVNSTFDDLPHKLQLEDLQIDCNSYLIPEVEEIEDGINFIDDKFADLFIMELSSWSEDQNLWPKHLTLKMFWEWFDVEVYPTTVDLVDTEITSTGSPIIVDTIH